MPSEFSEEQVLVTGATGFVGRVLCARLAAAGAGVRAVSRVRKDGPWHEHVALDIGDSNADIAAATVGVDTVFHLAALTHDVHGHADEASYTRINVDGTRRLTEAARSAGVRRFVFLSSVKAMGEGGGDGMDESTPPAPVSAYGRSKLAAERVVHECGIAHTCVLRSSLVYGPNVKGNLERMVRAVKRGTFPPLPDRRNRRAMIHVDDLAEALMLAASRPAANAGTYVVTDGREYSTRNMYEWIVTALGGRLPRWHVPWAVLAGMARAGDVASRLTGRTMPVDSAALNKLMGSAWYRSTRARAELGFEPRHTLQSAMPAIVHSLVQRTD